ncbi:helix-turn-helix transcriptional regulator [Deferrisoma palaeochoriense]
MGRKRGTETRTGRTLQLLRLFQSTGRAWSLTELADRLECTKQSVRPMIDDLLRAGLVEVEEFRRDRQQWFRPISVAIPPPVRLTAVDLQNLAFCRALVEPLLPESMREEVEETAPQLEELVGAEERRALGRALAGRVSTLGAPVEPGRVGCLEVLLEALASRRVCRVTYRSPSRDKPATYEIAPREIVQYRDALYLVCSYVPEGGQPRDDYEDITLAVHRLEDVDLLERTFPDRPAPAHAPRRFGLIRGEPFTVKARFTGWAAQHVRERVWSDNQTIEEGTDGSLVLTLEAQSRPEVVSWILGFGSCAELMEPRDLREEVRREAERIARHHAGDPGPRPDPCAG